MKFNWGHGITAFLIGFVLFMGYLTYQAFNVQFDLVAEDYYAQELAYETRLDEMRNANKLSADPAIEVTATSVQIQLPEGQDLSEGTVVFYDPIADEGDRTFSWTPQQGDSFSFPVSELPSQRYEVRIRWTKAGVDYFHKEDLFIQH